MKKLFIVTGEHSGDAHASYAVDEIKKLAPDIEIQAVGGKKLKDRGIKIFHDHSQMGVFGLGGIKALTDHIKLGKDIIKYLKNEFKPDLVLLVDYGGFNLRLAKELKKQNIEVFYYISPQVWASRKGRLEKIKKYISKMMVILPFEEKIHKNAGVNAEYVGHPLVSQISPKADKKKFMQENNLEENKKIIGIFPGSRKMEINNLLPIFLKAAKIIYSKEKNIQFCLGKAQNESDELINKYIDKFNKDKSIDLKIIKNQSSNLLSVCDLVIVASGTITLEAALYGTPMVVSYKGPYFVYFIYLLIRYLLTLAIISPSLLGLTRRCSFFLGSTLSNAYCQPCHTAKIAGTKSGL